MAFLNQIQPFVNMRFIYRCLVLMLLVIIILTYVYQIRNHRIKIFNKQFNTSNNTELQPLPTTVNIQVTSSKNVAVLAIDNTVIINSTNRGIHLIVLNQATAAVMAYQVYDTYTPYEDVAMISFIDAVSDGRIIIFAIKDEASLYLRQETRKKLVKMGSKTINQVSWRSTFAMVLYKNGPFIGEACEISPAINDWAPILILTTTIQLKSLEATQCKWNTSNTENDLKLQIFCNKYEGYGQLCNCINPLPLKFNPQQLENNNIKTIPVMVMASNRPHYLFRHLLSLLSCDGVNNNMITIFLDGSHEETMHVAQLFDLMVVHHYPSGEKSARILRHYQLAFTTVFRMFPDAESTIVLEEDLDVSPDLFNYFSQTIHLLRENDVYCISAWNDLGYQHTSNDSTLLYRVETMPGLGWILNRKLFINEFKEKWPNEKLWDWDLWMRSDSVRKGRECIIPDVSRTFHFGTRGVHIDPYKQKIIFNNRNFQTLSPIKLKNVTSLLINNYELVIEQFIQEATVLHHNKSLCDSNFVPDTTGKSYVIYIQMNHSKDYSTWLKFAQCLQVWYLDARGYHKSMWRISIKLNHVIVIGYPASPYAKFKPPNGKPFTL